MASLALVICAAVPDARTAHAQQRAEPTPSGAVNSRPVNSKPVNSVPLGPRALPATPNPLPSVVSGADVPPASATSRSSSAGAGTFASPQRAPSASSKPGGIGTSPLPFAEPVIDGQRRRLPQTPERVPD